MSKQRHQTSWTWKQLENKVDVIPSVRPRYEQASLYAVEEILGHTVPPTYQYYVQHWGVGVVFDMFIVWPPDPNPLFDIRVKSPEACHLIREHIESGFWSEPLHNFLIHLIPFGCSQNGDLLCWDPHDSNSGREMPIYLLDSEQEIAPFVGNSLLEFFGDYCINGKLNEVFPVGQGQTWNFPMTFVPIA